MNALHFFQLTAMVPSPLLASVAEHARAAEGNPAADFVAAILAREHARREERPLPDVPALRLEPDQVPQALAWCDTAANKLCDGSLAAGDPGLLVLAAMIDHIERTIRAKATVPATTH